MERIEKDGAVYVRCACGRVVAEEMYVESHGCDACVARERRRAGMTRREFEGQMGEAG